MQAEESFPGKQTYPEKGTEGRMERQTGQRTRMDLEQLGAVGNRDGLGVWN